MAHLKWTKDLETGIDVIDSQHQQIVDYINQLHDARQLKDSVAIGDVMDSMVDYTMSHFGFEETLMEEAGYQFAGPHKKVHELFTRRVTELQTRFGVGEDVSEELLKLLGRWLLSHVRHDDAAYVADVKIKMMGLVKQKGENSWLYHSIGKFFGRGPSTITPRRY